MPGAGAYRRLVGYLPGRPRHAHTVATTPNLHAIANLHARADADVQANSHTSAGSQPNIVPDAHAVPDSHSLARTTVGTSSIMATGGTTPFVPPPCNQEGSVIY
jgi:hypothetical protein